MSSLNMGSIYEHPVLKDIIDYAIARFNREYGYCGVATGNDQALLNSGNDETLTIHIKLKND